MRRALLALIYTLVFLTGGAGLVYQVVWQRYLARLLGNDSTSIAVILAVFLGGLSVGYWLCGRWTSRLRNCLRGYAALELAVGIWAWLFPSWFAVVASWTRPWSFTPTATLVGEGVFCAVLLTGLPALCMGGTIPLLTRGLAPNLAGATRTQAWVYGVNTAGACAGALLAGFCLIEAFGLPGTLRGTAWVNWLAALSFGLIPARASLAGKPSGASPAASEVKRFTEPRWTLYAVGFLSGAYVMVLENVLIRITNLSFGSSSYSFSLIVAVFVGCLAIGSLRVGARKTWPDGLLFWNQFGITLSLLLLFLLLDKGPYFAHLVRICFQSNVAGFWFFHATTFAALFLILALPVSLAGATLPLLFHRLKRDLPTVGSQAGALLSLNAVGCVAGSLGGGLLLYAWLDNAGIFLSAVLLAALSALLAGWRFGMLRLSLATGLLAAALAFLWLRPGYQSNRFAFGTFRLRVATPYSFAGASTFYQEFYRNRQVRFCKDGPAGTVAVLASPDQETAAPNADLPRGLLPFSAVAPDTNAWSLAIIVNGKSDSDVRIDRETLRLTAHLPALWAEHRSRVMIVGLGTGVTAGEIARYPEVQSIDVAEISPTVCEALPLFGAATGNVHRDPRLHLHIGDAFRVIGRSQAKWDVVISEPSNPWVTGVDQLFSQDYYKLINAHLAEGGVFVQWVQQYAFNSEAFGRVACTVKSVFPHFTLFQGKRGDLIILARRQPFSRAERERAARLLSDHPAVGGSLAELGIKALPDLLQRERPWLAALAAQRNLFGVETLDHPRLHYLAGRTFFTGEELGSEPISPFGGSGVVVSRRMLEGGPDPAVSADATP